VLEPFLFVLGPEWESHLVVHNADGSAFIDNYLGEVNWEAVIPPVKALRVGAAARAIPRAKAFEKAGIKTEL